MVQNVTSTLGMPSLDRTYPSDMQKYLLLYIDGFLPRPIVRRIW
jgi:hypothetical protein